MGYRLDGPALAHAGAADILSDATPIGAIQVPASGQPILLMAERQTTGGYAKIANVITADLPLAGQLAPGDWIEFDAVHARRGASTRCAQRAKPSAGGDDVRPRAAADGACRRRACRSATRRSRR